MTAIHMKASECAEYILNKIKDNGGDFDVAGIIVTEMDVKAKFLSDNATAEEVKEVMDGLADRFYEEVL